MPRTTLQFSILLLLGLLVNLCDGAEPIGEGEWTRFRGPNGNGISNSERVPTKWTGDDYRWVIDLPGKGHSSPVIWQDRVFVTSADEKSQKRFVLCFAVADGTKLWGREFEFAKFKKHSGNTFASVTPAVDENHVYVLWQSQQESKLLALTHEGKQVWEFDLGPYKSGHGTGSSPIVCGDRVIVCNDHDAESFLLALDRLTGKEVWRVPRIGDRACYSTPCVRTRPDGEDELIFTHSFRGITGVRARDGKQQWEIDVFGTHKQRAIASPVLYQDLIIGSSGFTTAEKNVVAVRTERSGDAWKAQEVYRLSKMVPHIPTPIIHKDRLYLWSDRGIVCCHHASDGKTVWQKRVGGNYFGSPICVNGYLYCLAQDGTVVVVRAADEFELVSEIELGQDARSTPAVSGGVLYLRTESKLFALTNKE